jgi:hypothetical protein
MTKIYNTGKVRIGLAYQPSQCAYHDRDALMLQSALLNPARPTFFGRIAAKIWRWL